MKPRRTRSRSECASSLSCERPSFFRPLLLLPLLLLPWRLLLGDCGAPRTFASARVRMRALAPHRQAAAMPQAAIGANVHQALDVHLDSLAQVAFDFALRFKNGANAAQIVFAQIFDPGIQIHLRLDQDRRGTRSADSVNVSKADLCTLIRRKIDTGDTSHSFSLFLPLFVFRVRADYAHHALAVNHLALITNLSYRRPHLHNPSLCPTCIDR